jgi:hypothetical protein
LLVKPEEAATGQMKMMEERGDRYLFLKLDRFAMLIRMATGKFAPALNLQ